MQTVSDYVDKIKSVKGWYWHGTYGQRASKKLWNDNKARIPKWYNEHPDAYYKAFRYDKDGNLLEPLQVFDCCGIDKYARWVEHDDTLNYVKNKATDFNVAALVKKI